MALLTTIIHYGLVASMVVGYVMLFGIAGLGALAVWVARKGMPESPRRLESVGRMEEAERTLAAIEAPVSKERGALPPSRESNACPFPTPIRLRGTGFCSLCGRAASVASPILTVVAYRAAGLTGVLTIVCGLLLVLIGASLLVNVETSSRSLEDIGHTERTGGR
jgi:hypothetical protein